MPNYISKIPVSITPYTLFIQPYEEAVNNCLQACQDESSLADRILCFAVGLCLLIPLINTVAMLILCACSETESGPSSLTLGIKELHFSFEDISFLAKKSLGLRHVSSRKDALNEAKNGFIDGCSLSLAPHQARLTKMQEKSWSTITPAEREEFIKCFEEGVDEFIDGSLLYDAGRTEARALMLLGQTPHYVVANLVNYCFLSIVHYGHFLEPEEQENVCFYYTCDHSSWGKGLGRFPKRSISDEAITRLPDVRLQDLGYSEEELNSVVETKEQGKQLYARMVACYRTALIHTIREKSNQEAAPALSEAS